MPQENEWERMLHTQHHWWGTVKDILHGDWRLGQNFRLTLVFGAELEFTVAGFSLKRFSGNLIRQCMIPPTFYLILLELVLREPIRANCSNF